MNRTHRRADRAAVFAILLIAVSAVCHSAAADDFASCNRSVDNPDEGIKACTRLLDLNPAGVNLPAVLNNRGNAWFVKGMFDSAITDFTAAIQRDPTYLDAYRNRGLALHRSGDYDRALADFNYAIEHNPNGAPLYNARGTTPDQQG
jgi:tetratricopeptide (TPR) repeat protein